VLKLNKTSGVCSALSIQCLAVNRGGRSSAVESQPSKLAVVGSTPTARSKRGCDFSHGLCETLQEGPQLNGVAMSMRNDVRRMTGSAHVAQLVEHVLGKDEVTRSIRVVGSTPNLAWAAFLNCMGVEKVLASNGGEH
jgi:hypothetical protein